MTNLVLNEQRIGTTISSLKKMIEEMDLLMSKPENRDCTALDIVSKFLNNNVEVNEKIKTGKLNEVDLSSLESGEKFVLQLIPAAALRHYSRALMSEIKKSISNTNRNDLDGVVLLISILLLLSAESRN